MKTIQFLKAALLALAMVGAGTEAHADEVSLAKWDFGYAYEAPTDGEGVIKYYTPTATVVSDATRLSGGGITSIDPRFYPNNVATGISQTACTMRMNPGNTTATWKQDREVFQMLWPAANNITDYTNGEQHTTYYEAAFTTQGYKDISVNLSLAYGGNAAVDVDLVFSLDEGATWHRIGQYTTAPGWTTNLQSDDYYIGATNQEKVLVRLLTTNGLTSNWRLHTFEVKGTAMAGGDTPCTLTVDKTPSDAGSVYGGGAYVEGEQATVKAESFTGYNFKEWQKGGVKQSANNPYTFVINANTTMTAVYEAVETYTLTVNKAGDGAKWGEVSFSPEPVGGVYQSGTEVTVSVVPNSVTNFLYWDNSSSETSRLVTMDGNKEQTATFDVVPFVVAWDFRTAYAKGQRNNVAGEYAYETSNTGNLTILKENGSTVNWGNYNHNFTSGYKYCARRYTNYTQEEYRTFVASFNVADYDKVKVHFYYAYDNTCLRKTQLLQYSTTSATANDFVTAKTIDLTAVNDREWTLVEQEIDTKDINGMLYLRWIEDTTSDFFDNGSHGSNTEGFYLADVVIYGDQTSGDDTEAPQLLSSSPAEGSTNATAKGNFVLNFNERIQAGAGSVTLNGQTLTGTFGSKTVSYAYHGLTYGTTYTLSIGENAITDLSGNAFPARDITFTVMTRPTPEAKVFDAVVAKDGTGDFTSVQAAIDAAPTGRTVPYLIFIKNGIYEELVEIPASKPYLHLIGQDSENTIIKYCINNQGATQDQWWTQEAWDHSTNNPDATDVYGKRGLIRLIADNLYMENITAYNSWGYDQKSGPMALAFATHGDRQAFNKVKALSFQDTWFTDVSNKANRHYINNSRIEGAVDYFYGGGDVYIENTTFYNLRKGSVVTAPSHATGTQWGYVMDHCTVDGVEADKNDDKLGRPWLNAPICVWLNCTMTGIAPEGWTNMGTVPALFAEYGSVDKNGDPIDLNNRKTEYTYTKDDVEYHGSCQAVLTSEEAAQYTYEAVTGTTTDDWNPRKFFEEVAAPANVAYAAADGKLTWTAAPYARCYLVIDGNSKVIAITKDTEQTITHSGTYTIQSVNEYGSLGGKSTPLAVTYATPYTLTVSAAKAATLVLPYEAVIPNDVKVYTLTYTSGDKATANEVTGTLPANTPVLVNAEQGSYEFAVNSTTDESIAQPTYGALTGVYQLTTVPTGSYVLQNHGGVVAFYKVNELAPQQVNPYRAYLTAQSTESHIDIDFGETTNIISTTDFTDSTDSNSAWYDLQGRKVNAQPNSQFSILNSQLKKGLYIVNGKKVIVR